MDILVIVIPKAKPKLRKGRGSAQRRFLRLRPKRVMYRNCYPKSCPAPTVREDEVVVDVSFSFCHNIHEQAINRLMRETLDVEIRDLPAVLQSAYAEHTVLSGDECASEISHDFGESRAADCNLD